MKVYAVFCSNKNPLSLGGKLLRWAEKITFSHCAVLLEDASGHSVIYESVWPKSRKMNFEKWLDYYKIEEIYQFPIPGRNSDAGSTYLGMKFYLKGKLRKWYSIRQLFWIGVGLFIKPLSKAISSNKINGSKHLICTELQGDFFKHFYGAKWNESTDTISLVETRDEIKRIWSDYAYLPEA